MTDNPLARSRLDRALRWLDTEPNAPRHYTEQGNVVNRETIRAAIDALLNPKATFAMRIAAAPDKHKISCADIYTTMITELTKEVQS